MAAHIVKAKIEDIDMIVPLIAAFRCTLRGFMGLQTTPDVEAAYDEFMEYMEKDYPIFIYKENHNCVGYLVCRIDAPVVWVESLFVDPSARRRGIASVLYRYAEKLAHSYGQQTLYNCVHPNNDGMIAFLAKRGYDVLNLIEIRKKRPDEAAKEKIAVGNNAFRF